MLRAVAAGDAALVAEVTDLVNLAYEAAEEGLWLGDVPRTTLAETADAVARGQLAVARDQGRLVGSVRIRQLDGETGWLGVLAVAPSQGGCGIGGKLVEYAEGRALLAGASTMQLELLVPEPAQAHTDRLAAWYRRLGYREVERRNLADLDPAVAPSLAAPCDVAVMRKRLASAAA